MKKYSFLLATLILTSSIGFSQCPDEAAKAKKYKQMAATAQSWDVATPAGLCAKYFKLACDASQEAYTVDGNTIKKSQQAAQMTEDEINVVIEAYNKESNKLCGTLSPVKAKYSETIGDKEAHVVGYWVAKDDYYGQVYYPQLSFFNGGNFKTSVTPSLEQRSSWEKISDFEYQVTTSEYSDYDKKYSSPSIGTFTIDPATNTAVYTFTRFNGEPGSSTWYYKGKVYSTYNKSEAEILKPVTVTSK
ncbi:hypothetical protein [Rasiella sp. SM2506]|uniref:hypothetical protein n=1 Tax=Rasiella sp. SM2506 TaxID=3423914 RepID=UPI003D78B850